MRQSFPFPAAAIMLQPKSSKNWRRIEKSGTDDDDYDDLHDYGVNNVDDNSE